jgi:hypothetical protein
MSKYYTPTREEFCEGFLYEYNGSKDLDLWNLMSHSYKTAELFPEGAFSGSKIRVKYLDREDIESLGFEKHKRIDNYYMLDDLIIRLKNNKILIFQYDEYTIDKLLFEGTVKNKSELKRLLKQLKIIE